MSHADLADIEQLEDELASIEEAMPEPPLFVGWSPQGYWSGDGCLYTAPGGEQVYPVPTAWWQR